jgi:hypothetical protein|tara:strand:+ start:3805 stop:4497 length:693 start_codon:yes stop_codon:yes gene_type:complete
MKREVIYEIITEETDLTYEDLEAMLDNDLITILLDIGNHEIKGLETGIDWDYVRNELNGMDWYESDGGYDEERQVYLGTCFSLMPSGKYYMPFACSNVEPCPVCEGNGSYGEMTCKICRGEGERGIHPDDDISKFELIHKGQKCMGCDGTGKTTISCDYCESIGSREAYLDSIVQEKLETEAEEYGLFITSGEGDPCDIFAGECRDIEEDDEDVSEEEQIADIGRNEGQE